MLERHAVLSSGERAAFALENERLPPAALTFLADGENAKRCLNHLPAPSSHLGLGPRPLSLAHLGWRGAVTPQEFTRMSGARPPSQELGAAARTRGLFGEFEPLC